MNRLLKVSWVRVVMTAFVIASMAWPEGMIPATAYVPQHTEPHPIAEKPPNRKL
ncbi:MAG: hypothetical protein M1305_06785 [Candidatus Marsarchaeota archaeon]|nr:hypothetical protein [Candidatus Marsarchaeota archaeon]